MYRVSAIASDAGSPVRYGAASWELHVAARVARVTPSGGPAGATVTISGEGFEDASTVRFGSVDAADVTRVSSHTLSVRVPAGLAPGVRVVVSVTTNGVRGDGPAFAPV